MEFGTLKLKRCLYGWMLFRGPYIGKCFDLYGEYSESEVALMRSFIRPGNTVIDVGANIGDLTVPLSAMVGSKGRIYAVESNPSNFNVLCGNLALNQIDNVKPINAFIRKDDAAEVRANFVRGHFGYETMMIDEWQLKRCDFIKIDVDGNELDVLMSAEATIREFRPFLYFENDVSEKSGPLLSYVLNSGYTLYWHLAPIFRPDNFFGNPSNHWAPERVLSIMVFATPPQWKHQIRGLPKITSPDSWWTDASVSQQMQDPTS